MRELIGWVLMLTGGIIMFATNIHLNLVLDKYYPDKIHAIWSLVGVVLFLLGIAMVVYFGNQRPRR